MEKIHARTRINIAVALGAGYPAAGRHLVSVDQDGLAGLAPEERAALALYTTTESAAWSTSTMCRDWAEVNARELELSAAPSWDAVLASLRAAMEQAETERQARVRRVGDAKILLLSCDPGVEHGYDSHARKALDVLYDPDRSYYGGDILAGRKELPKGSDPEVLAWVVRYRNASARRQTEARIAKLGAPTLNPDYGQRDALGRLCGVEGDGSAYGTSVLRGDARVPGDTDPRVAPWVAECRRLAAEAAERSTREAAEREAAEKARREAIVAWAAKRDSHVQRGIERGYDMLGAAARAVESQVIRALSVCGPTEPDLRPDGELTVRTDPSERALDMLETVETAIGALAAEPGLLPPGIEVAVLGIGRRSWTEHSQRCMDIEGPCVHDDDCMRGKRTVVTVEVRGMPAGTFQVDVRVG